MNEKLLTFGERLRSARLAKNLKQDELAKLSGVGQSTISDIERGIQKGTASAAQLAAILGVNALWLADNRGPRHPGDEPVDDDDSPLPRVPIVGTAQLGDDGFWHEFEYPTGYGDGYVRYPMRDQNGYALRVKGDSMRPRLKHGEFVVVSPNSEAHPGDEVAVKLRDGRVMVKVFDWQRGGSCQFSSVNEDHKPMTFSREEIEFIHLVAGTMRPSSYYPENS